MIIEVKYTYDLDENVLKNIMNDFYNNVDKSYFFMDKKETINDIIDTIYEIDDIFHYMDNDCVIEIETMNEEKVKNELYKFYSAYYNELYNRFITNDCNNNNSNDEMSITDLYNTVEELREKIKLLENKMK